MATKTFSANSAYVLEATASRSGTSITVTSKVTKKSGSGYSGYDDNYTFRTVIDGTTYNDTWGPYSFTGSTPKTISLGSKTKTGMSPGSKSWSVYVAAASSLGSASVSGTVSIPVNAPSAPTIGTPALNSDSQITVTWTRNASSSAPYTSQVVQRRTFDSNGWGDWKTIATLTTDYSSSGGMSYVDKSVSANRVYAYRVGGVNASGTSYSGSTQNIFTTPGAPSALAAVKQANGSVKLTITNTVVHTNYDSEIEYSTNGGSSWTDLVALPGGTLTYIDENPSGTSAIKYRARTLNNTSSIGNNRASGWRESVTVPLSSAPNAPTSLQPSGVAFPDEESHVFTWQYNTTDTSEQSAYAIEWRLQGSSTWDNVTGKVDSTSEQHTFPAGTFQNGEVYEWHVRTWGADASKPSDYSATATFTVSARPSATIIAPSGTLAAAKVTVDWDYSDEEGTAQSAWKIDLIRDDVVIESRSESNSATAYTMSTRLEDATEYSVRVQVRDGSGLWSSWVEETFTTSFPPAPTPILSFDWDPDQGATLITIENPSPASGQVAAVSNTVLRSYDGGETWETAIEGAPLNTTIADRTVRLGDDVLYRVYAWSDLPSASAAAGYTFTPGDKMGYWSAGEDLGITVQMKTNLGGPPGIDLTTGLAQKTVSYFAGRRLPVELSGVAVDRQGSAYFLIVDSEETKRTVEAMSLMPAPHLFRLPDGLFMYASIGAVEIQRVGRGSYSVSVPLQEVSL